MEKVIDFETEKANNIMLCKVADLQRAMIALTGYGHKVTGVQINSDLPVIQVTSAVKGLNKELMQAEINFAGKAIAKVIWKNKTTTNH